MRGGGAARLAVVTAALLLAAASLAALWPGYALYDTVGQYRQALAGDYNDWHPPIMARLWALLHGRFGGTTGPMLMVQLGGYWLGLGLIAEGLAATGRWRSAVAVLMLAASPLLLGWQGAILKDAQMLGALIAAVGIVAAFALRDRRVPIVLVPVVALIFGYALLVRANAVFAVVPLIMLLAPRPAGLLGKLVAIGLLSLVVIAAEPSINHRLFHARATGVEKTQPLYDLAAIGVHEPAGSPFTQSELTTFRAKGCVKPFFWDPLGDEFACSRQVERLQGKPPGRLYRLWVREIAAHPVPYARHRLAHWNSTERWLVPPGRIGAEPPATSENNDIGLGAPSSRLAKIIQSLGAAEAVTPLGWPIVWTFLALAAAPFAWARRNEPAAGLALALAGSAVGMEASFLVVSIASDLRYHLWSMTASALALTLLADRAAARRGTGVLVVVLLTAIIAAGLHSRATLPRAPATYRAMIDTR
ncbi:MAG: hypothetical protein ABIO85_09445 [Sphingomicrobium sp.]